MAIRHAKAKADPLGAPALRTFLNIADRWRLSPDQRRALLGKLPESTYYKYAKTPEAARLSYDTLERISHLVGIFKAINILLPRPEQADGWVHRANSNSLFKGRSALEYMLSGRFEDIVTVRRHLDAARGW